MNFWIENKDAINAIGILLTIVISSLSVFFSVRNNRAVHYVNAITKHRLEWVYKFKDYLAEFIKTTSSHEHKTYIDETNYDKISTYFDELAKLVFTIEIHLNFKGEIDQKIINLINQIVEYEHINYFYVMFASYIKENKILEKIDKNIQESEEFTINEAYEMLSRHKDMYKYIESNSFMKNFVEKNFLKNGSIIDIRDNPKALSDLYMEVLEYGDIITKDTELQLNKLRREVRVYLKFEWNRIKIEATGKKYTEKKQRKDLKKLYSDYDQKYCE